MRRLTAFLLLAITLLTLVCSACAEITDEDRYLSEISFQMMGSLDKKEKEAPVLSSPGGKAFAVMKKGDSCRIIGHKGSFYQVVFKEKKGYVRKRLLQLKGKETAQPLPEEHLSKLKMASHIPSRIHAEDLGLTGAIRSSKEMDALMVFVWDQRKLRPEFSLYIPLASPAASVQAGSLKKKLALTGITAGRKTLVIEGLSKGEATVLYRAHIAVRGDFYEPAHVTNQCKVSSNAVLNNRINAVWRPESEKTALTVEIPEKARARLLTLEWLQPPESFTVKIYAKGNEKLSEDTYSTGFYLDAVTIPENVRKVKISAAGKNAAMITLRVYPERYARHAVQTWQPLPEKLDLVAVSTHQDDEFLFLGGTVAYSCGLGKKTAMVYMTDGGRTRYREALDGMWTAGLRIHPVFFQWRDAKIESMSANESLWKRNNGGKDPRIKIVRFIRQYKPDVIVTQDFDGEYGHNQHKLCALLWADAVKLCKDPAFDPSSAEEFGVWDVKKHYVHLYAKNQITMNWNKKVGDQTVFTPLMLTKEAFSKHRSQQTSYSYDRYSVWYDNRKFGLYYSSVGPDVKKDDFFENIPAQ